MQRTLSNGTTFNDLDPDFKVTTFLKSNIGKRRILKTKLGLLFHTNRKLYLTYGMILCLVTLTDL